MTRNGKTHLPILYVDMENVLVGFPSGIARISDELQSEYDDRLDEVSGIFSLMNQYQLPLQRHILSVDYMTQLSVLHFLEQLKVFLLTRIQD